MVVRAKLSSLKRSTWRELAARFTLGGLATVMAGAIADLWGPDAGGLFLAFPAIFCASATLIEKHERKRKESKGLQGERRGKDAAALDSAGAGLGGVALAAFGAMVWLLADRGAAPTLAVAAGVWFAVALSLWLVRRHLRVVRSTRSAGFRRRAISRQGP